MGSATSMATASKEDIREYIKQIGPAYEPYADKLYDGAIDWKTLSSYSEEEINDLLDVKLQASLDHRETLKSALLEFSKPSEADAIAPVPSAVDADPGNYH